MGERRYVVCLNEDEARKDAADREAIVAALREQLRSGDNNWAWHKISVANLAFRTLRCTYGRPIRDRDTIPDALPVPQRTDPATRRRSRGGRAWPGRPLHGISGHGRLAACDPFGSGSIAVPGDLQRGAHPSGRGRTPQDRGDRHHPQERSGALDRPGHPWRSGVAVAMDLQERPQVGRGTPGHGARYQPPHGR